MCQVLKDKFVPSCPFWLHHAEGLNGVTIWGVLLFAAKSESETMFCDASSMIFPHMDEVSHSLV